MSTNSTTWATPWAAPFVCEVKRRAVLYLRIANAGSKLRIHNILKTLPPRRGASTPCFYVPAAISLHSPSLTASSLYSPALRNETRNCSRTKPTGVPRKQDDRQLHHFGEARFLPQTPDSLQHSASAAHIRDYIFECQPVSGSESIRHSRAGRNPGFLHRFRLIQKASFPCRQEPIRPSFPRMQESTVPLPRCSRKYSVIPAKAGIHIPAHAGIYTILATPIFQFPSFPRRREWISRSSITADSICQER